MTNGAAPPQLHPLKAGLEDVIVSPSEICFIDGQKGRLLYRGFDVDDLVAHSTFEEVVYLLWHGRLPTRKELETHRKALEATVVVLVPLVQVLGGQRPQVLASASKGGQDLRLVDRVAIVELDDGRETLGHDAQP